MKQEAGAEDAHTGTMAPSGVHTEKMDVSEPHGGQWREREGTGAFLMAKNGNFQEKQQNRGHGKARHHREEENDKDKMGEVP